MKLQPITLNRPIFLLLSCIMAAFVLSATAQTTTQTSQGQATRNLTMKQTIALAQEQSIQSMMSKNVYASEYWRYRSYRAGRLPSLIMNAGIGNINRSMQPLQNYETGEYAYRPVFTFENDVSLFLRQRIAATGGEIRLQSSLRRLDQFSPDNLTWYSQPITLQYIQPLFTYNAMRWEKKIAPQEYEAARVEYLEAMEEVTIRAASSFWSLAMAELNRDNAVNNHENSKRLYRIAQERLKLGTMSRNEVLQLELSALQDSLSMNSYQISYAEMRNYLASFVGLRDDADIKLSIDYTLPGITLDYQQVLARALENSSFELNQRIALLEADQSVAQARGSRGVEVSFNAQFGLSQSDKTLANAYSGLRDQQVAGFQVSIPILDWGQGRGRVKMAQSQAATTRYRQEQARADYEREIFVGVMEFNAQQAQCDGALRAKRIADEGFALSVASFERGTITVLELNTAQSKKDSADRNYIQSLATYWNSYFTLRKTTLYDFLSKTDIADAFGDEEFNRLVEN